MKEVWYRYRYRFGYRERYLELTQNSEFDSTNSRNKLNKIT